MNRLMKKGLILMMVISAVLLLAGCQLAGKSGKGIFSFFSKTSLLADGLILA